MPCWKEVVTQKPSSILTNAYFEIDLRFLWFEKKKVGLFISSQGSWSLNSYFIFFFKKIDFDSVLNAMLERSSNPKAFIYFH